MNVSEVTVQFEAKVGLPNYSSAVAACWFKAAIGEDDDPDDVARQLFGRIRDVIREQAASVNGGNNWAAVVNPDKPLTVTGAEPEFIIVKHDGEPVRYVRQVAE